jgi:hypothetical protein
MLLQGDNDVNVDLGQAMGGVLLVTSAGKVYGVSRTNADPDAAARLLTGAYSAKKDRLKLAAWQTLAGGKRHKVKSDATGTNAKYDGIYLLAIRALGCGLTAVQITVAGGIVSGVDPGTGEIGGTVDDRGNINFTTEKLSMSGSFCPAGEYLGPFTFTGQVPASPLFPLVLSGTFSGPGPGGNFTVEIPVGPTGATAGGPVGPGGDTGSFEDLPRGNYRVITTITATGFGVVHSSDEVQGNVDGQQLAAQMEEALDEVVSTLRGMQCSASRSSSPWEGDRMTATLRATCRAPEITVTVTVAVTIEKV